MSLLYEAALRTHSTGEPVKAPENINPTPGVEPRSDIGKAVWMKDPTRESGGVWVARSKEERDASGIMEQDCVIVDEIPEGLRADGPTGNDADGLGNGVVLQQGPLDQQQQALSDMQSGLNVNPQMNYEELDNGIQSTDFAGNVSLCVSV